MTPAMRDAVIRVPVRLIRSTYLKTTTWTAEVVFDKWRPAHRSWQANGKTEKQARDALTAQILGALDDQRDGMIVIVGGSHWYAGHIHLVIPIPCGPGWTVEIIRDGVRAGAWTGGDTQQEALDSVLAHVGGSPKVVRI